MSSNENKFIFRYDLIVFWALVLLPLVFWSGMSPLADRFNSSFMTLTSIGQITGLIGMSFVAFSMVLQIRLNFLCKMFLRTQSLSKLHHYTGFYGLVLLLVHPIVLALRFLPSSVNTAFSFLFTKNLVNLTGLIALILMIISLYVSLFLQRSFRYWKLFHQILLVAYLLIIYHLLFVKSDISRNGLLDWYILSITLLGGISFTIQKVVYYLNKSKQKNAEIN